ncbi:MAG: hypothetical protein WC522_02010 [Candidatus Omnitrophota bacterium]
MKRNFVMFAAVMLISSYGYASDYQGNEEQGSIFQKLGDLITGRYEVEKGKTLKEKGVVQVMAEQVNSIQNGPVR